uniref:Uncharacterized protein n=1 Tax=Arundo donax TaxID=35708 RepID=A0A0A9HD26_ARUDO
MITMENVACFVNAILSVGNVVMKWKGHDELRWQSYIFFPLLYSLTAVDVTSVIPF